ncbi:MAG TPA: PhzF family phenazine biosynthesis protein [Urbifossiella sp.]|jgi:PhzF family phenazine biosynthesis protein|nr:PhzF family phenazine biosynthesis protein [Urbifossiella sp.]
MPIPLFVVDAFTDRPFAGNPAAVCLLEAWPAELWLAYMAREMNLSETAFLVPLGEGEFDLRWFTPTAEVDLCGHATLASAHVLWESGRAPAGRPLRFRTRSGLLTADLLTTGEIVLDFPAKEATRCDAPAGLLSALGAAAIAVARNQFDYLVELATADELSRLRPDFGRLAAVECRGVIVTAPSDRPEYDFLSRFFAPAVGVDEDPVTGSAHCCLAGWWGDKLGRDDLTGFQASARGGVVRVVRRQGRVALIGRAVTVTAGTVLATPDLETNG